MGSPGPPRTTPHRKISGMSVKSASPSKVTGSQPLGIRTWTSLGGRHAASTLKQHRPQQRVMKPRMSAEPTGDTVFVISIVKMKERVGCGVTALGVT